MGLQGTTLIALVRDILQGFIRQNAKSIVLLNGHFENSAFLCEAARQVLPVGDVSGGKIVVLNWWEHVPDETLEQLFPEGFPGWEFEHASLTETSLMLALVPELVRVERIPKETGQRHLVLRHKVFPEPSGLVPESGILYSATEASGPRGEALLRVLLAAMEEIIRSEFSI
jgi:creatinine amidohydrolase